MANSMLDDSSEVAKSAANALAVRFVTDAKQA